MVFAKPHEMGIDPVRLQAAYDLAKSWTQSDAIPAIGIALGRKGKLLEPYLVGRQKPVKDSPALRPDALFLIASITKPLTVGAAMVLVERGKLSLGDRVSQHVPAFTGDGRDDIRILHVMTHTSGLPDMVKDNEELRKQHKPLPAFIEAICREPLLFLAGTKVNYQSTGSALLAEIVHQVSGRKLPEFLKKELFEPLGMNDTSLGWDPAKKDRIAAIRVPPEMEGKNWNWNSPYWLGFGAPWGGLITSPADLSRYLQMMWNGGKLGETHLFSSATVQAMTTNQLECQPRVPEEDRRCKPWGLGWRLNWPGHPASFGDLLSRHAFGHAGATGTVCWVDPAVDGYCALFTTQPDDPEKRMLTRLSNMVRSSFLP